MSQPDFPLRITNIVSDADRAEANVIAAEITGNPVDANTYSVELIKESDNSTWWGCSTAANDEMVAQMQEQMRRVPSVKFFLVRNPDWVLLSSNVETAMAHQLEVFLIDDALNILGLKRRQREMPTP